MTGSSLNSLSQGVNVGQAVATIQEFTYKTVSLDSGTTKDISGKRCILRGVWINTTLANAVTVKDGANSPFVIPAGSLAGSWFPFGDVGLRTNCSITHTASAGALTFIFKSF